MKILALILISLGAIACGSKKTEDTAQASTKKDGGSQQDLKAVEVKGNVIHLNDEVRKNINLKTQAVDMNSVNKPMRVPAVVTALENNELEIRPLTKGRLEEIKVVVGQEVRKGQVLAMMDNIDAGELLSQYGAARAELQRLKVQELVSKRVMERNRRLVDIGAVPAKELELSEGEHQQALESIRAQESTMYGLKVHLQRYGIPNPDSVRDYTTVIRAPFDGVILSQTSAAGAVIDPAAVIFRLANVSRVYVDAQVYEKDLGRVRAGQVASVSVDTYPNRKFPAKVIYVSDSIDPNTRSARVRCELKNSNHLLKINMFAAMELTHSSNGETIRILRNAVQKDNGKSYVFVMKTDRSIERRQVQVGDEEGDNLIEVKSGLKDGDEIVTEGAFHLSSIMKAQAEG